MKKIVAIIGASALLSLAYATEQAQWPAPYRQFKGEYTIYSGELGDQQAPTHSDRKLSFIIEGQPAKEIFNAMPPDDKETCSGEKGARSRSKDKVWCTFNSGSGYTCYFGFDLRTGKSIAGGLC
ncbi:hypothetical protein HH212_09460 [Massilia forsythiae]|uniref:DUF3617 family protein n=1 Tax=Massilia forsythiae TaxID=2728020 RepID=A0A7Z2ZS91_9BURK|nr:hypothetical protein [Massilia forsythiae]QJE00221.1 hypothetical protein HH212_09460 [Massilia forsythiae]